MLIGLHEDHMPAPDPGKRPITRWWHPICLNCEKKMGVERGGRGLASNKYCCFCGKTTNSGHFIRANPRTPPHCGTDNHMMRTNGRWIWEAERLGSGVFLDEQ